MPRFLAASAVTLALALAPAAAADWPQWRGPNRDGVAPDAKLPAQWPAEPPAPKWTAAVGLGYSGPAVAAGKVFIMGRVDDPGRRSAFAAALGGHALALDRLAGKERCLAFDADTGNALWTVEYPEPFEAPDPTAGKGPNATPTVDRDRVYMLGLGGQFHCLDVATGRVLWKHDCPKEYWGVKKGPLGDDSWFPPCGASAGALVDGDTVVLPVGGAKAGAFTAFDRTTGEVVWKALDDRSSYASPLVRSPGGVEQLIGFTGTRMVGLRHADRQLLWDVPFPTRFEQTIISPVVWKDLVIVAGEGKATQAVRLKGDGSTVTKEVAWKSDDLKAYLTTPVVFADHLLGHDMRTGKLACVDLATGKTAWTSARIPGKYHSLVVAGDKVLVLNSEGELFVFKADPAECTPVAKWALAEKGTWAHLAVAGGRLYVKGKESLTCYELK